MKALLSLSALASLACLGAYSSSSPEKSVTSSPAANVGTDNVDEHTLNGCDPQVPPRSLADSAAYPVNLFWKEEVSGTEYSATVSWYVPVGKSGMQIVNLKDNTTTDFEAGARNSVKFTYNSSGPSFEALIDGNGSAVPVNDYPKLGAFLSSDNYKLSAPVIQVVPRGISGRKRVHVIVTYRGLTTAFGLQDA